MLFELEKPARALPSNGRHPRRRRSRRRRTNRDRRGRNIRGIKLGVMVPPPKMGPRAPGVDPGGRLEMLPEVEQHVDHARSHLPRRRERSDVVAVADDFSPAAKSAVDGERQPDGEAVHAATGTARLVPLDDEVPGVLLDGEMDHAESIDRRTRDGASERPEHPGRPEGREPGRGSDRDLQRISGVDLRPRLVRHRRSAARLSPGPLASPAPFACHRERQPQLPSSSRLDSAHVPVVGAASVGLRGSRELDSADVPPGPAYRDLPAEGSGGPHAATTRASSLPGTPPVKDADSFPRCDDGEGPRLARRPSRLADREAATARPAPGATSERRARPSRRRCRGRRPGGRRRWR